MEIKPTYSGSLLRIFQGTKKYRLLKRVGFRMFTKSIISFVENQQNKHYILALNKELKTQ
jgi:hypothetical protein